MKKEFFLNIIFLIVANLLIKPLYLLWIEVEANNLVGPSNYGTFAGIFSLCYIFQLIADPGLLNYNTTQVAADRKLIHERLPILLGLKLCLALFYVIILLLIGNFVGYEANQWVLFPWIIANLILISFNLFLRSNISAIGKYRWDSLFSILDKALMIAILAYMMYYSSMKSSFEIIDFIQGQTIAFGITFAVLIGFLLLNKINVLPKFNFQGFKKILEQSLPYAWLLFFMTIYTRIDSFMLERLLADDGYQAGVYASAFRLFDAGNSFSYLFAILLLPMFSNMLAKKVAIVELFSSSFRFLFTGITIVSVFASFWSSEIMSFFYPIDSTDQYNTVFILLMLALIPMSLAYVSGTLLTADARLKLLNKLAFAGVIINICLNIWLIEKWQSSGAALATLVTQSIMTVLQVMFVIRAFKIKIPLKEWIFGISFIISVVLLAFICKEYSPLPEFINFSFGIIISFILSLIFKRIEIQSIKQLITSRF